MRWGNFLRSSCPSSSISTRPSRLSADACSRRRCPSPKCGHGEPTSTHTCWLAAFQEAIGAFASVSPPSAHFFFNSLLRKFLNLCSSEEGVTERCGLLELLRALSPTLEQAWPHASPPPAAPCMKESHAPSVAIAAAVPSRPPPAREPQRRVAEEGVQGAQSLGLEHTLSGQPCHDSCARRQVLAALLASPLPPGLLMEMRSALDGPLDVCTRVHVQTAAGRACYSNLRPPARAGARRSPVEVRA